MRERLANLTNKYGRRALYALCAFALVWIDVVRSNGAGHQWQLAANLTGFCILPVIVLRFARVKKCSDAPEEKSAPGSADKSIPYALWFLISGFCGVLYYRAHALPGSAYNPALAAGILEAVTYGAVAIALWRQCFSGRKGTGAGANAMSAAPLTAVFYLWAGMLAWCILSVNEAIWPLWFLVMFGALFLQPASREDNEELLRGLTDGILL
ncbi:MAG: hypothetical protein K5891_01235, partial [Lachnospiraceae bacterium]|nr:hypothetical protein [Lachnospiraceae bacterium]